MSGVDLLATVAAGSLIAIGVAGTVLPVLPGLGLVWATMLAYGLVVGFGVTGWVAMALATALAALGTYLGVRLPQASAAAEGISMRGQLLGLVLAVVGFFVVPVVGAPLGFVVGVWLVRWWGSRDAGAAWRSTRRSIGALLRAGAAQLGCAMGMALTWAVWVLAR